MAQPCKLIAIFIGMVINGDYRRHHSSFVPADCDNPRCSIDVITPGTEKV